MKFIKTTASVYTAQNILRKIAYTVWPERALVVAPMSTLRSRLCHLLVARAIIARKNSSDIIWLYGHDPDVYHSVLTTQQARVIVGGQYSAARAHGFNGDLGFKTDYGTLELVNKVTVAKLIAEYIR